MILTVQKYFHDLNLFELETIQLNDFSRHAAIITTRLYITSLALGLIILTCFVALNNQSQTIIVRNPSQSTFLKLNDRFSSTLSCPCRKITIPLGSFSSITTTYHPICNSIFVSDRWINLLFNPNISLYYPLDFRSTAIGHFQLLSSLCSLARQFVNDAIDDFSADAFLTQVVLSKNALNIKIQTLESSMQTTAINSFRQVLELMGKSTFSNRLATTLQTSMILLYYGFSTTLGGATLTEGSFSYDNGTTCRCRANSTCTSSRTGFFDIFGSNTRGEYVSYDFLTTNVMGFVSGCFPIESLLKSTLECLFDASCLFNVLAYFPHDNSTDFHPLNSSQTRFSPDSTVTSLLDSLLVESWSRNVSFNNYYDQCSAILCVYTVDERVSFLYIITQLLGFYGGLTVTLRLLIPRIVLAVFNRHRLPPRRANQDRTSHKIDFISHISEPFGIFLETTLLRRIRSEIIELNLFRTRDERNNLYDLQTSKIATRAFLVVTTLCVMILSIYTTAMIRSQTIVIQDPSQTTFKDLQSKYSNTLKCPCNRIAIKFESFTHLYPRYHSVCSSQFISSAWIDSVSSSNWMDQLFDWRDFRVNGPIFFNALSTYCNLIQFTVMNYWFVFKQAFLITEYVLSDTQLMIRGTNVLNQFKSDTLTGFRRVLLIIQFQTSTLLAIGSQNYGFLPLMLTDSNAPMELYTQPFMFGNCSCALNDVCPTQIGFFNFSMETALSSRESLNSTYDIPQLFFGCFAMQFTPQSSLQCFFNQSCLDTIQSKIISPKSINISILRSNHSRFRPETPIIELINELMIEDWGESIDYSAYFTQCQPKQCTYTINSRSSVSFIVAFVIGLFGGVVAVLKLVVPIIVRFLRQQCRPRLGGSSRRGK